MAATLLLAIITIALFGHFTLSILLSKPVNKANSGEGYQVANVSMNCSSDRGSAAIRWYFTLFSTASNVSVAVGANVAIGFVNVFWIDQPNSSSSNLIMFLASNLTAGTYTCSDETTVASAQFIAMTYRNIGPQGNISNYMKIFTGDIFYYSASFCIYGNDYIHPQLYILKEYPKIDYNFTDPELTKVGSLTCAKATVIETATCATLFPNSMYYISMSAPKGNLPVGSDTKAPDVNWEVGFFAPINVTCVPTDASMTISGLTADNSVYFGETISCSVESSTPVIYTWTDFTYGNTSTGQTLAIWHNGTYQCHASAQQSGKTYSGSKTVSNLFVLPVKDLLLSASPLFGPIAGGTIITFSFGNWPEQIVNISAVYIGDNLAAAIVNVDRENKHFVVVSPPTKEDQIQRPLQITVECTPGLFSLKTGLYFTYRSNPEITGLCPNSFIVTGGLLVNVTGSSLSSVANPLIQVTLSVTRVNPTENFSNSTTDTCNVVNSEGTEMVCRMPPVNLPNDFLDILASDRQSNGTTNIVKTNSSVMEVLGSNGKDRASVYLGFILDGYKKYNNLSNALPGTQVSFYSSPEIISSQKVYEFDPNTDGLFLIPGNRLTLGCRLTDYVVRVGNVTCENVDLQDNALTVRLPKIKPQLTQSDIVMCETYLNIRIIIGYKEYHYCCLKYKTSYTVLIIAVCVGVGGFLLLLFTIIGIVCCYKKYSRNRTNNNHNSSRQHRLETVDRFYEGSKDYSKTGDGYLQTIELERTSSIAT